MSNSRQPAPYRRLGVALALFLAACASTELPVPIQTASAALRGAAPVVVHGAYVGDGPTRDVLRSRINDFERLTGKRLGVVHLFVAIKDGFPAAACDEIRAGGAVPFLSVALPGGDLTELLAGSYDGMVRDFAAAAARWGSPILLRWGWEMNGDHAWSGKRNGGEVTGPLTYRRAWERMRQLMAVAPNLQWVWCPDAWGMGPGKDWNDAGTYYPGTEQVDWLGVDGYGWKVSSQNAPIAIFDDPKLAGRILSRCQQAGKPIIIAETAADRDDDRGPAWTEKLWNQLGQTPGVRAICWFNRDQDGSHWRLEAGSGVTDAYRRAVADPRVWGPPPVSPFR